MGGVEGDDTDVAAFITKLRLLKTDTQNQRIPDTTEIVYVARHAGPYPGIFLHTCAARMLRQCIFRKNGQPEWVSSLES